MKLEKLQAVEFGASWGRTEGVHGGLYKLCCGARSQEPGKVTSCQASRGGKVGSSVGGDRANSRCQLRAALGLASALDVIS